MYDCDSWQDGYKKAESGLNLNTNILLFKPFNSTKDGIPPVPKFSHVATEITTKQEAKITVIHTLFQLKQYSLLYNIIV
jgi:hypothetical protein